MKRVAVVSLIVAAFLTARGAVADTTGIVLMHGLQGSPNQVIDSLATALQGAGYLVETPEMCWSRRRIFDQPFLVCLQDVDSAVGRLRSRGARKIVVSGVSMGGLAALVYGARHGDLAGIVALAPANAAENTIKNAEIAQDVAQARAMVAAGRGDEIASFNALNYNGTVPVRATAAIYLSFLDPQGAANMANSLRGLRVPLLWVAGDTDPIQRNAQAEFNLVPANPLDRFVTVPAAHLGTPNAAKEAVLAWLPALR
jgi:esterase/lipase